MPASAEGFFEANVLKRAQDLVLLTCYQVFGTQDKIQRKINFLANPLRQDHGFSGFFSGLAENPQKRSLSKMKSLQIPHLIKMILQEVVQFTL